MRMTASELADSLLSFIAMVEEETPNIACPRCGVRPIVHPLVRNALSRIDNRVYVCSICGVDEALKGEGKHNAAQALAKWHVTEKFGLKLQIEEEAPAIWGEEPK